MKRTILFTALIAALTVDNYLANATPLLAQIEGMWYEQFDGVELTDLDAVADEADDIEAEVADADAVAVADDEEATEVDEKNEDENEK